MLLTVAVCAAALLAYFVIVVKGPKRRNPPSVGWLPLAGSFPFLKLPLQELFHENHEKDPIVTVHYGLEKVYYLNSYEAMRETMIKQGDKFLARPNSLFSVVLTGEYGGIIMSNGQQWRDYRRFTLKVLRDFGFGRRGAEEIIQNEAHLLCELIEKLGDSPQDTTALFTPATSNVICQLVFGSRLASEDPKFERMRKIFEILTQKVNSALIMMLYNKYLLSIPFLLRFVFFLRRGRVNIFDELISFCREQIQAHRLELKDNDQPKDYIDAHLQHQPSHEGFNDIRLTLSIVDLFIAGTETTSTSLSWAILLMVQNPDVAEKIFQEINTHIGSERMVSSQDKGKLHYTMATIEEINRMASIIALGLFHVATEDANVCGYEIEEGSIIMYNLYGIHRNSKVFPEPQKFKPERYLDADGRFVPNEQVVTFGLGKRACLGESLARAEMLVFFCSIMQRFRFRLDPADTRSCEEILNQNHQVGGIRAPAAHKIVFSRR